MPSVFPSNTPDQISGRVGLVALGGQLALAGPAAGEVGEQILDGQLQPGRAAVDNTKIPGPVADARRGDPEQLAERVACHARDYIAACRAWVEPAGRRG